MNLIAGSRNILRLNRTGVRYISCSASSSGQVRDFFYKQRDSPHSNILTKKETNHLYKIQFHSVKPGALEDYKNICSEILPKITADPDLPVENIGSWSCWYGEQDQVVHLWRYSGGFDAIGEANQKMSNLVWYREMRQKRSHMLLARRNQLLFEFSFWNSPEPRPGPNIYELRTYKLKPGTLIEWANNWARGIGNRQTNNEAVGGFFSEIGDLNVVHHLWAYESLQHRKVTRGKAWFSEGWDNVVYYTVLRSPQDTDGVPGPNHSRKGCIISCLNDQPYDRPDRIAAMFKSLPNPGQSWTDQAIDGILAEDLTKYGSYSVKYMVGRQGDWNGGAWNDLKPSSNQQVMRSFAAAVARSGAHEKIYFKVEA